MRPLAYRGLVAAGMAAALGLAALAASGLAHAAETGAGVKRAGHDPSLGEEDEIAALEAIRVALTEVGDGTSYVWRRRYGRFGGLVQPTKSFKDGGGRVCRHIIVILTAPRRSARMEGTACRLAGGRWQLGG